MTFIAKAIVAPRRYFGADRRSRISVNDIRQRWHFMLRLLVCSLGLSVPQLCLAGYTPPTGIPAPPFGIDEVVSMYSSQTYDFGSGPVPYPDAGNGPYTHYIDNTSPKATDTNNPYGTASLPRKTIPYDLAAGSVVELHGGPYTVANGTGHGGLGGKQCAHANGTASKPVFLRSPSASPATFGADLFVLGSYLIVENLKFYKFSVVFRHDLLPGNIDHISVRACELYGDGTEAVNNAAVNIGPWFVNTASYSISDVVVYANNIHTLGLFDYNVGYDYCGVTISGYDCHDIWVLDNTLTDLASCGIRAGNNSGWTPPYDSSGVYVGRNTINHMGENAFAAKLTQDVVVSENYGRTFQVTAHNSGAALNCLYNPINVWFINNNVGDCEIGIKSSGVGSPGLYAIGNIVSGSHYGIEYWSGGDVVILNNTLVGITGFGIDNFQSGDVGTRTIENNVVRMVNGNNGGANYHLYIQSDTLGAVDYNDYWQETGSLYLRWLSNSYSTLAAWKAGSGKGAHDIAAAPIFASTTDFTPQTGSPLIDAGTDISTWTNLFTSRFGGNIALDANHTARPQGKAIEIGAIEYTGNPTPTPSPTATPTPTPGQPDPPNNLRIF